MNKAGEITIVVSCDSHYLVLLATLLKSIEVNSSHLQKLVIYVVENDISASNKLKLCKSVDEKRMQFKWINLNEIFLPHIQLPLDKSSYPINIYARIFIPFFIPSGIDKVLYLDVDMIVQKDITDIFDIDLGDYLLAAVTDYRIKTFDNSWGGIINYKDFGLSGKTKYFNSGLLLVNVTKWKEFHITEAIIECIEKNKWIAKYPDQYGLNVILANKWLELDPLWNNFANVGDTDPYIIHFVERKPIFQSYNNDRKYQEIFFGYLALTQWKNFKPIGEFQRITKKLINIFQKVKLFILRL